MQWFGLLEFVEVAMVLEQPSHLLEKWMQSVDSGHRREVCALMKKEFPNTQFIMTTHDPIWLRHMKTEKLIDGRAAIQFRNWDIEQGPTFWDDRDVWTEIDAKLNENNVRDAAGLLRHFLEFTSGELCHRLRARVVFRGDARYQLGELLPSAIACMRKLYKKAKDVANSWNQEDVAKLITERETIFASLADASRAEEWQMNTAIHYNFWDNLSKEDFQPVAKAFQALLDGFMCQECEEYIQVSPDRETPKTICCGCGKVNLNLIKKIQSSATSNSGASV